MKKIVFLILVIAFTGCKKNQLDGNLTIKGKAVHHSIKIPYCTIFVKFNATEFPGADTTKYDAKFKADAGGNYLIKCYPGSYFLYGVGLDFVDNKEVIVRGGVPVKMRRNETRNIDVPVFEE